MSARPETNRSARGGRIAAALFPIVFYMGARAALIAALPPVESFDDWVLLDLYKNLPRLIALLLAASVAAKTWEVQRWPIWNLRRPLLALALLAVMLALEAFHGVWNPPHSVSMKEALLIAIGSLLVGVYEEFSFRFLLLDALTEKVGTASAVVLSSAVFMVFHYQAQALWSWPYLFLAGIQFCMMRLLGISLIWIMLVHAAFDSLVFWLDTPEPNLA